MKKIVHTIVFFCSLTLFLVSCSSEDDASIDEETGGLEAVSYLDVAYGPHSRMTYDLYLPEGRTQAKTKTIMLIHGGGWTQGDKEDMTEFVQAIQLAHPDHAVVNINYVLSNVTTPAFPNQFLNIEAIIDKLNVEGEELQISREFGMIGVSAGAHLALMYDSVYDTDDQVKFVANIVGPTDFTDPFYLEDPNFNFAFALLVDEASYPENAIEAVSPAYNVHSGTSPVVMFYGNQDPLVPLTNGTALETALNDGQVSHSFTVYDGGHGDDWSATDFDNLQQQISDYIEQYLPIN
ncbi:alpha/beta hydrolase [Aureisphaera galaxeae]|uniref:alpha/beta hydrolase n=1 Tax=Aureisphaera galaxeae TaxID=1538023 RepID=UPI002350A04D|nr:alpha/beta hydrolase [Aureisphaera galaxeae]MDC8004896.1 alpha/beta hydrolase [Aureisphaera galaxeae]